MSDIHILLDGQPRACAAGTTLAALVATLSHAPEAVATAVNGEFVARGARGTLELHDGDTVALFQAIVGG